MIRVVVADDDPVVRAGLRVLLEAGTDLEVVGEAADGAQAVAVSRSAQPDVVLMDVRMPHIDGIAATATLMRLDPGPRVLMLTTFEEDALVARALAAGASGYLLKRSPADLIVRAVRTVASGDVLVLSPQARSLVSRLPADPDLAARLERLTPREAEVLRLVAAGRSNSEIAAALVVSVETVKTHVGTVLTKLDARDRTNAAVLAWRSGFVS